MKLCCFKKDEEHVTSCSYLNLSNIQKEEDIKSIGKIETKDFNNILFAQEEYFLNEKNDAKYSLEKIKEIISVHVVVTEAILILLLTF